ncbi:MAG: AAA family ATPase [Clostridia bacterium]|nr:AAA family ATPase [Clostridia bacterium]
MQITKIVITGGPCGGKSTALSKIHEEFEQMGYTVLFVPETATELISGGVAPWTCGTNLDYQKCHLKLQLEKETAFEKAASTMNKEKILIVCDRGALDSKAYMSQSEFDETLKSLSTNEIDLRDNYSAVFHLVTAAKGAEYAYTLSNNCARTETVEQARELDDKIISAWTGHPHLRIIDNSIDFDEKISHLIAEIASFLGEPEPYEIERKFLIEYPDLAYLDSLPNCQRLEIIQTYLKSPSGEETRVRQRGIDGNYVYFQTTKRKISDTRRIEIEKRLTKDEYLKLLSDVDTTKRQIRKTRYCLVYENQYFEIDIYPFWNDKAIMEIELRDEKQEIILPTSITVIKEVTDDDEYKNSTLAKNFLN